MTQILEQKIACGGAVDYDIHGLVGVRLVAPSQTNVAAVNAPIGPPSPRVLRRPDIVVSSVDRLPAGPVRYVDLGKTEYSNSDYIVLHVREGHSRVCITLA